MRELYDRITATLSKWEERVDLRNAYNFGDEEISLTEFSELFKETFEIMREVKNEYIYKGIFPVDTYTALEYQQLLTTVSKYTTYDCVEDESEDKRFTATCIVADQLLWYASIVYGSDWDEDKNAKIYIDTDGVKDGELVFWRSDYPYFGDDESEDERYTYNVYEGNFDEVLELASQL